LVAVEGFRKSLNLLTTLEWVDVSENPLLKGKIPKLNHLKNLKFLDISNTQLEGKASKLGLCPPKKKQGRVISYSYPLAPNGFQCDCHAESIMCLAAKRDMEEIEYAVRNKGLQFFI